MLKRAWNDPVWSKVIAGSILAAGALVGTYLLNWWPAIGDFVRHGYNFALSPTLLPNWLIGVLALLTLPTITIITILIWKTIFPPSSIIPDWRSYTTDKFFDLRWRWRYFEDGQPYEAHTFCPHCDFEVYAINASAYTAIDRITFRCDSCNRNLGEFDEPIESLENKAKRFIQQKIRNGSWASPQ